MSIPPTPGEYAQKLAEQYVTPDPNNPFNNRFDTAKKQLVLRGVAEAFGPDKPISQFCRSFARAERLTFPANWTYDQGTMLEEEVDLMRDAWETIEQDYMSIMDQMNGKI